MTKTVQIQIGMQDLQALKDSGDQLCIARFVNNAYSVVWRASGNYLTSNKFSWTSQCALFGSNSFEPYASVQIATNVMNIGLGETATLSENGSIGPPMTGGPATAITLVNQYGLIYPGLSGFSTGIDGNQMLSPMFVAPKTANLGPVQITPVDNVLIWFQADIATSTMIAQRPRNSFEVNLTNTDSVTCIYQNAGWSQPYLSENEAEVKTAPKPHHHQHGRH